jgi:hypothetical protein
MESIDSNTQEQAQGVGLTEDHVQAIQNTNAFVTFCGQAILTHRTSLWNVFETSFAAGALGSFKRGVGIGGRASAQAMDDPDEGKLHPLIGACVQFQLPPGVSDVRRGGDTDLDRVLNCPAVAYFAELYKVSANRACTQQRNMVIVDIYGTKARVVLNLMTEESFHQAVAAVLRLPKDRLADGDWLGDPAHLCKTVVDRVRDKSVVVEGLKSFVLHLHYDAKRAVAGMDQAMRVFGRLRGTITKLVTLKDTAVRALGALGRPEPAGGPARGRAAAAAAVLAAGQKQEKTFNTLAVDALSESLVRKPARKTDVGLYTAMAELMARGGNMLDSNRMKRVWMGVGQARVDSLRMGTQVGDLPDITELFRSLVAQYAPDLSAAESSRCITLLREQNLLQLGGFDVFYQQHERADSLLGGYLPFMSMTATRWLSRDPTVDELRDLVVCAVEGEALSGPVPADASREDCLRLLRIMITQLMIDGTLDHAHRALAAGSHPVLRCVAPNDLVPLYYLCKHVEVYRDTLEDVAREINREDKPWGMACLVLAPDFADCAMDAPATLRDAVAPPAGADAGADPESRRLKREERELIPKGVLRRTGRPAAPRLWLQLGDGRTYNEEATERGPNEGDSSSSDSESDFCD